MTLEDTLQLEDIFTMTSVLGSTLQDPNNFIYLNTGDAVTKQPLANNTQMWQTFGIASRPALAEPGIGSAESINLVRPNGDISVATRDLRTQQIYGNIGPGETCIYATGPVASSPGQARIFLKADGSTTIYTTGDSIGPGGQPTKNTASGAGVYLKVAPDRLEFQAPWGVMIFDVSGFHIKTVTGASFDLNNMVSGSGLPSIPSIPGITPLNTCNIQAQSVTVNAPQILLGPDQTSGGLTYLPAAYSFIPTPVGVPITGVGVGAVVMEASASTKVYIGI